MADLTGLVEYKYAINGFADQENLVNDMVDGASCAPVTDYAGYANRQIEANSTANDSYGNDGRNDGTLQNILRRRRDVPGGHERLHRLLRSGESERFLHRMVRFLC